MQAAALLYQITKQKNYLEDAQNIAEACHKHFFTHFTSPNGQTFQLLKKGNIWFTAVMLRGFIELYHTDHNKTYLADFQKALIMHGNMPGINGDSSKQIGAEQIKMRKNGF